MLGSVRCDVVQVSVAWLMVFPDGGVGDGGGMEGVKGRSKCGKRKVGKEEEYTKEKSKKTCGWCVTFIVVF